MCFKFYCVVKGRTFSTCDEPAVCDCFYKENSAQQFDDPFVRRGGVDGVDPDQHHEADYFNCECDGEAFVTDEG